MDHVAIMKKSWGLLPKITTGEKTVESRWYKAKVAPWDRIGESDTLYFKDSGAPVILKTKVTKVLQFEVESDGEALDIMKRFAQRNLGVSKIPQGVLNYITNKKYAIFVFFNAVEEIKPFNINKTGFGMMSAWLSVNDINEIKQKPKNSPLV